MFHLNLNTFQKMAFWFSNISILQKVFVSEKLACFFIIYSGIVLTCTKLCWYWKWVGIFLHKSWITHDILYHTNHTYIHILHFEREGLSKNENLFFTLAINDLTKSQLDVYSVFFWILILQMVVVIDLLVKIHGADFWKDRSNKNCSSDIPDK